MELLSEINPTLFFTYFSSVIISTFDKLIAANQAGKSMLEVVKWSEAELALHLLYIFKGGSVLGC
jgi:hypothetical protein